jgi:hypothetical protein
VTPFKLRGDGKLTAVAPLCPIKLWPGRRGGTSGPIAIRQLVRIPACAVPGETTSHAFSRNTHSLSSGTLEAVS